MLRKDFDKINRAGSDAITQLSELIDKATHALSGRRNAVNALQSRSGSLPGELGTMVVELAERYDQADEDTENIMKLRSELLEARTVNDKQLKQLGRYFFMVDHLVRDVTAVEKEHAVLLADIYAALEKSRAERFASGGFVAPSPTVFEGGASPAAPELPRPPAYASFGFDERGGRQPFQHQVINIQLGSNVDIRQATRVSPTFEEREPSPPKAPSARELEQKKQQAMLLQIKSQQETLAAIRAKQAAEKAAQEEAMEVEFGSKVDAAREQWETERKTVIESAKRVYMRFEDEVVKHITKRFTERNTIDIMIETNSMDAKTAEGLRKTCPLPASYSSARAEFMRTAGNKLWSESYGPTLKKILKGADEYQINPADYALADKYMPPIAKLITFTEGTGVYGSEPLDSFPGGPAIAPNVIPQVASAPAEPAKRYQVVTKTANKIEVLRNGYKTTESYYPDTDTNFAVRPGYKAIDRANIIPTPQRDVSGTWYYGKNNELATHSYPAGLEVKHGEDWHYWNTKSGERSKIPPEGPDGYDQNGPYWIYSTKAGDRVTHSKPTSYIGFEGIPAELRWETDTGNLVPRPPEHPELVYEYEVKEEIQ